MESKKFPEFTDVKDCNSCANYWDDSCDGASYPKPCTSYRACRKDDIPKQIQELNQKVKELRDHICFNHIIFCVYVILNSICWLID